MSLFGNIVSGVVGIGQAATDYAINKQNLKFQQQNLDYQKELQKQIFGREDNAVQRRAHDLQAAGLSKTLAAGEGAGAGSVVGTSAPQMGQIDFLNRALSVAQAQADIRKTNAETEEALKRGATLDSQILNDQVNRDYTQIKTAIEQGNLDMLPLSRQQKEASIRLTNRQLAQVDEVIQASVLNRKVEAYKFAHILPKEVQYKAEQIAILKKQGQVHDADIELKNLQGDLLVQNINSALFESRIKELDYYYQVNTGLKPRSASPYLGDLFGAANSKGYKDYFSFLSDVGKKAMSGYNKIVSTIKKDKTPK